jgi:TetR/AcrR family transcriptional regulator
MILDAAEELFARNGYDATSLAGIGEAAGVSRGTPSYFFGSKEALYLEVLERIHALRNEVLGPVFAPLADWAETDAPSRQLRDVLTDSVAGYLRFLRDHPAHVDVLEREALAGGQRLGRLRTRSTVMEDAFSALRRRSRAHGLHDFDVGEAIMCLVGLGFVPVALRHTVLPQHGLSLDDPAFIERRTHRIVDVLLHIIGAPV